MVRAVSNQVYRNLVEEIKSRSKGKSTHVKLLGRDIRIYPLCKSDFLQRREHYHHFYPNNATLRCPNVKGVKIQCITYRDGMFGWCTHTLWRHKMPCHNPREKSASDLSRRPPAPRPWQSHYGANKSYNILLWTWFLYECMCGWMTVNSKEKGPNWSFFQYRWPIYAELSSMFCYIDDHFMQNSHICFLIHICMTYM